MLSPRVQRAAALAMCVVLPACSDPAPAATDASRPIPQADAGPGTTPVDDFCPGTSHCRGEGADDTLYVGVGRANVNPTLVETEWSDTNGNHAWDRGEPFVDVNGNGRFDGTWMAGFGNARAARGIHDDLEVRAMAWRWRDVTVAWAVIDAVGYFINDMDAARAHPALRGVDVDRVIISATHVHQGVDTVGLWGVNELSTGLNPAYQRLTHQRIAEAVRDAVRSLRPARMRVATAVAVNPMTGSTLEYVSDVRDPVIYDPTITLVQFTSAERPAETIGTWVNFASHPEYAGSRNNYITADYVHWLRDAIEAGETWSGTPGVGGMTLFVNGALGGQVGPGGASPLGRDGQPIRQAGLPKAEAAGRRLAQLALTALARNAQDVSPSGTVLQYRTTSFRARTENVRFHIAYRLGIFNRELFDYEPTRPVGPDNQPIVRTRVSYLQVGPVATITAPGELHPELWVGTTDRMWSWGQRLYDTAARNPPDLARAPAAPYLRELMLGNPGVRWAFVSGLAEDFLGYIVPTFNFAVHPDQPYIEEAEGDHYEETNSLGAGVEELLQHPMMALARWRAPR